MIDARRVNGADHVHNLQTTEGWYAAGGLIVSNCRCEVVPIVGARDPGLQLNAEDLRRLYEAAGGTGGQGLRRLTVAMAEHVELGLVLTDVGRHYRGPREVARTRLQAAEDRPASQQLAA